MLYLTIAGAVVLAGLVTWWRARAVAQRGQLFSQVLEGRRYEPIRASTVPWGEDPGA
jgi:hypothetical protein